MNRIGYAGLRLVGAVLLAALLPWSAGASAAATWQDVRSVVATRGIATDGTRYVAAAGNGIWTSADLKTWQHASLPATAGEVYNDVIWDGSHFIAVGDGVISSPDGSSWTVVSASNAVAHLWNAIAVNSGIYIVVGSDGTQLLRSTDGTNWTSVSTGVKVDSGANIVLQGIGSNGTVFVASGFENPAATTPVVTQGDVVLTSPDGRTWTQQSLPSNGLNGYNTGFTNNVAWGAGMFITGGGNGIYTSPDGVTWAVNDFTTVLPTSSNFWIFDRIQFANSQFVVVGVDSVSGVSGGNKIAVFTSSDGVHWTNNDLAALQSSFFGLSALAITAGQYVAAGSQAVYSSSDATTWSLQHSGTQTNLSGCLIQGGGKYILPGEGGTLASSDGTTWPDAPPTVFSQRFTQLGSGCGAYGNGAYVAIYSGADLFWSTDAANWTVAFPSPSKLSYQAVAWNGSEFLAVGTDGNSTVGIATSPNGKTWTESTLTGLPVSKVEFGTYGGLIYANGQFVAWGSASGNPFIATSADGSVWKVPTTTGLPAGGFVLSIAYGGGTYMALVNTSSNISLVFTSTDGINWSSVTNTNLPNAYWTDLIWGNAEFMAVGVDPATGQAEVAQGSAAGVSWQATLLAAAVQLTNVLWDGSKYVAVSDYDILTLSPPVSSGSGGGSGGTGGGSGGGTASGGKSGGGAFDILALSLLSGLALRRRERWMRG